MVRLPRTRWAVQNHLPLPFECFSDVPQERIDRGWRNLGSLLTNDGVVERRRHGCDSHERPPILRRDSLRVGGIPLDLHRVSELLSVGLPRIGWFNDLADTEDLGRALVRNHKIAWFELAQRPYLVGLLADRWSVVVVGVAVLLLESRAKRLLGLKVTKVAHLV